MRLLLGLLGLQLGAEGAGQGADLRGDHEIAAHEALHRRRVAAVAITHSAGDLGLQVEAQPLLGPAGGVVQVAAHRPQEVERPHEGGDLAPVEHVELDHAVRGLGRMQVLGDPEQGVQVAQAALALLDVGLDHVAAGAGPGVTLVAFLQLGAHELGGRALDHLGAEPALQLLGQLLVAGQPPRLQDRGADGEVLARELDALLDGAGGVADFETQVPQGVEHELDDALGVGGGLVGAQEQKIDVREGRQRPAAVAAHGHQSQPFALCGVPGPEHMHGGEVVERGDHLVGDRRQQPRGLDAAGALVQPLLGDHPAPEQRRAQDLQRPLALLGLVADGVQGRGGQLGAQLDAVDDVLDAGRAKSGRAHARYIGRAGAAVPAGRLEPNG